MTTPTQHGKPGSPFGSRVSQFPDQPKTPVEEKGLSVPTPAPKDLTTQTAPVGPSLLEFIDKGTVKMLSDDQKNLLNAKRLDSMGYWGSAAMKCLDHQCAYKDKCHLFKFKIPRPLGEDCPIELMQMANYKTLLMNSLSEEDRGDPFLEMQINDLVHIMMQEARAYGQFGIDGGVIEVDDVKGIIPSTGEVVRSKVVHRAFGILERLGKRKERLFAKLLATPQDRAKADKDGVYDRSKKAAKIGERLEKMAERRRGEMKKEIFIIERSEVQDAEHKPVEE